MLASSSVPSRERDTIGRYELLLELGRGGMAVLYLARAQGVGGFSRLFAIKQILPHLAADPQFVDMFLNEGRIAARLSHPNLCPVFELAQERGELFLVMEYLDGVPWETLAAAAPHDPRRLQLTAGVLAQACQGLHHAHTFRDLDGTAMSIIHRDVSPQNLFVSADGVCRVLDFGVSKVATDHRRTHTGLLKGKLPYMAPEQIRGEPLDARADIWAVGVMLWEALTGRRLFDRDTDFLTYLAIASAEIPSVNTGSSRYPPAIDHVIARALARDRDARYPTAPELAHDLQHAAAPLGGAASREHIAAALTALCGPHLTARRRAIADAVTIRATPRPTPTPPGDPSPTQARPVATTPPDAAETISMAMRRDAIVVARATHRRRRTWTLRIVASLAAVAAAGLVVAATQRTATPANPPPSIDPAATASPGTPSDIRTSGIRTSREHSASSARTLDEVAMSGSHTSSERSTSDARTPEANAPSGKRAPAEHTTPSGSTRDVRTTSGERTPGVRTMSGERTRDVSTTSGGRTPDARTASGNRPPGEPASGGDPAPALGWYAIDSSPYATIYVDGRKLGDTPLDRIPLTAGTHRVRAVLADGRERSFAVEVAADRKTSSGTLTW